MRIRRNSCALGQQEGWRYGVNKLTRVKLLEATSQHSLLGGKLLSRGEQLISQRVFD